MTGRTMPPEHHDITKCRSCEHAHAGGSTGSLYCRSGPPQTFAHQMRQACAPCGPSALLFLATERSHP